MKFIISILLTLFTISIFSQDLPSREIFTPSGMMILDDETEQSIIGDTYLDSQFSKATLITTGNKKIELSL